jgi:hypothetical protein
VRDERTLLSELSSRISTDLKRHLKLGSFYLDDVERFFLAPEVLRHLPCSESEMARWLDNAETVLSRAVEHRKWIKGFVERFGPDARVVRR